MRVEAVVFDIGRVLITWDPLGFFDRVVGPERRAALFAEVPLEDANAAVDLGAPFTATFRDLAAAHPDWAAEIMLWHDRWFEMASPALPDSVSLMRALRARGVQVFALSNFGDQTFDIAQAHYAFFTEFDRRYISGRLKLKKPDPAIYEVVERDSGIAPERLFFTDDSPDNIAAAAARGWQTHLFETAAGLAAHLTEAGLLPRETP